MNNNIKASAMDSVTELSPKIKRSRSTFNLNIKNYTSFNLGELVVIDWTECLPGDTFNIDLSTFIRLTSPSKRAPMDSLHMDVYAFFVPYRFLDKAWVNIQGENPDPWAVAPGSCSTLELLTTGLNTSGIVEAGSLLNHLGIPAYGYYGDSGERSKINIYPIYSYFKLINDWFRDENLQAEIAFDNTNGDYEFTDMPLINGKNIASKGSLFKVAKYHDVFTSALPSPQKGPSVGLLTNDGKAPIGFSTGSSTLSAGSSGSLSNFGSAVPPNSFGGKAYLSGSSGNFPISADLSGAVLNTINELRLAFQLQKAYELDARSGTRYTEALEARFSVKNPDLRLGRSELLGHYRFNLNMQEINSNSSQGLATGDTGSDVLLGESYNLGVGAGASKTANGQHICVKSFLEHGICMIVGCVRPDLTYQQGLEKYWFKTDRFSFYEPIFSNIGEVPIMKSELFAPVISNGTSYNSVFGYQEAWYEYRYKQSHISGVLESNAQQGFDIFHYGQDFESAPVLGSTFIQQDNAALNRTLAFGSTVVDNFIAQFVGTIKATRVMPLFSVPGLIDHF